ncbi:hypothetical protein N7532_003157 [Penicillium argentinense]|uniref:N-acetyltransferase domain-containing protein n=1 Tax=Penicillium argentinense TaxID=1131581 RepID=A0A9W9KEC7_9EURO|nr:uncharacterized protein N7532_003157 [Penicillium argentinense]KAJ5102628.1 hypothetical protein N7532_003157 [Penicillium argentinense]
MIETTSNLAFSTAGTGDAGRIQQLIQSAFRAEDNREGWVADLALNSRFTVDIGHIEQTITQPESDFLIATDSNGKLVATVGVSKREPGYGRIFMLAVDQRSQCGGLGREVLTYAEKYCQQIWGISKLGLDALSTRQALISWYRRRGYLPTQETKPFPREMYPDLALPEDLCFVQFEKEIQETIAA